MHRFIAAGFAVLAAVAAGCSEQRPDQSATQAAGPAWELIATAPWVREQLASDALIVVDVRDPARFAEEHIAGAVNVPVASTYGSAPGHEKDLAAVSTIESLLGGAGLSMDVPVVVYDDSDFREAARMFWVLEVHGHPRVAVLNGGLGGWKSAGFAVSSGASTRPGRRFIANLQPDRLVSKLQVLQSIGAKDLVLLDARSVEEYSGEKSPTPRAGHIPTAINIDFMKSMTEHGGVCELSDADSLRRAYSTVLKADRVITYCNTGTHASVSYLVLRNLGREVAMYDGSWAEWSMDHEMPIETGVGGVLPVGGVVSVDEAGHG